MKHPSTQALFAYWTRQRGSRPAPDRSEIDPADIRHALGDTLMLAADFVDQLRFRLAGTRVCALFGRELKGEAFASLWSEDSVAKIDDLLTIVIDEQISAVAGLTGRTADGDTSTWNCCCCRSPIPATPASAPSASWRHCRRPTGWARSRSPISNSAPCAISDRRRHLAGAASRRSCRSSRRRPRPRWSPSVEDVRVRHGFVVYSGGRDAPGERTG